MKKLYTSIIILCCLLTFSVAGCTGKKSSSSGNKAKAQTEISGRSEKSESKKEKEEKQLEKDRKKLYDMRSEYMELTRKVMNTPDPIERSRISDKMDRLNRQIGDLEVEILQKYGKPY
ncbi:MAG: hypothetical protein IKX26_02920 [Bacteroidales bacterium]|nr:hypothetical protein [Bacteroidales bacterium]